MEASTSSEVVMDTGISVVILYLRGCARSTEATLFAAPAVSSADPPCWPQPANAIRQHAMIAISAFVFI